MENNGAGFRSVREGGIVKAKVIRKENGDIFCDIEYKSEGMIPADETVKYGYYDDVKEGDSIDVLVKRMENENGFVVLSKIVADKRVIFGKVKKAFKENVHIEGKVVKAVKGGYIVDFGANVTAFMPMSHSRSHGEDLTGMSLPMKVIQLDEEKRNVVVSHREYVAEAQKAESEKISAAYPAGQTVKVTVAEPKEAGIEVEREGIRIFIPAHEMSWKKVRDIKENYPAGRELEVLVVQNEKGAVNLSMKRLKDNPFEKFVKENKPGDRVDVTVAEILAEGLVVSLNDEMEGYIHASEISYFRRIKDLNELYKKGDVIKACIVKIDDVKNRIYLSVKRLEKNPWQNMDERYPAGARVVGTIKNIIEGDGAEVELEENVDAFMHVSNVSWFNFTNMSEVIAPGEKKEFRILGTDKTKYRIMLGLKQLAANPWNTFVAKHKEGSVLDVKITDIDDSSVTCEIVEGVSGRISIKNKNRLNSKKGDIIKARVVKIDKDAKKVQLAAKDLEMTEEKKQLDEYMKSHEHGFKLNDLATFGENSGQPGKGDEK